MLRRVAVVGALRTGTNYLKYLLERNYPVDAQFHAFGWKHAGVPVLSQGTGLAYPDLPIVYVVKNPYAFVISLHRYLRRRTDQGHRISLNGREDFADFLTHPIVIFDSQLPGSPQLRFPNPIQYWNFFYWNLETLDPEHFSAIGFNYEDLVIDPAILSAVEPVAGLEKRQSTIAVPQNEMKRLNDGGEVAASDYEDSARFDARYYTEKRYLEAYSPEQLSFVGGQVDPWLMNRRGYETA